MPHYNQSERQAFSQTILGIRVDRATATLPKSTNGALFTIAGGLVLMTAIIGEVTTIIEVQANVTKLTSYPTAAAAADTDLCTTLDIGAATPCNVGEILSITGTPGDAMVADGVGSVQTMLPKGVVLQEGTLDLDCGATNTGNIKWSIWYMPLEKGGYVVAA